MTQMLFHDPSAGLRPRRFYQEFFLSPHAFSGRFAPLSEPLFHRVMWHLIPDEDRARFLDLAREERTKEIHSAVHNLVMHVFGQNWGVELTVFEKPVWKIRLKKVLVDENGQTSSGYGDWTYAETPWRLSETVGDEEIWSMRFMTHQQALAWALQVDGPSRPAQALIAQCKVYEQFDLKEPWSA